MIRRDDSQPGCNPAIAVYLAPLLLLAGCSGPTAEAPPTVAPAVAPAEAPAKKPAGNRSSPAKHLQPDDPGYSGKGGF